MKREADHLDARPSKRLFSSIIADYDVNRSVSELIDNAIDIRLKNKKPIPLHVGITMEERQQTFRLEDDAGGVPKAELHVLVGPGHTSNRPTDETIGIFGVGSKRGIVAMAEQVAIITRHESDKTYRVEWDEAWLTSEDWELPVYEVDPAPAGTTTIDLSKLRFQIDPVLIAGLTEHLGACYARFLERGDLEILLNRTPIKPVTFENWAFPPEYSPRKYTGTLTTEDNKSVKVVAVAGLMKESSPTEGEYGVYVYCNDRLVARALKSYDVGFSKGQVGFPHPELALARVVLSFHGEAQLMPWNSSKSGINPNHRVFAAIRNWLIQVVKDYASLSRRWKGRWDEEVFKHKTGKIEDVLIDDFPTASKSYLPPLPQSKPRYPDVVRKNNEKVASKKPWVKGLYESISAVDSIGKLRLEQKNRILLILLDSTIEIAFKEYLVNESGTYYSDAQLLALFKERHKVDAEVDKHSPLGKTVIGKIKYYHGQRSKLVHERSAVTVSDDEIEDFRATVEALLGKLFRLRFER